MCTAFLLLNDANNVEKESCDSIDKQQLRRQLAEPIRTFNVLRYLYYDFEREKKREIAIFSG